MTSVPAVGVLARAAVDVGTEGCSVGGGAYAAGAAPGAPAPEPVGAIWAAVVPARPRAAPSKVGLLMNGPRLSLRASNVYDLRFPLNSSAPVMATPIPCNWSGVFPAATTQFDESLNVDLAATQAVQAALIRDGVHGMVVLGRSARTTRSMRTRNARC